MEPIITFKERCGSATPACAAARQSHQGRQRLCPDHVRPLHRLRQLPELSATGKAVVDRMGQTQELLTSASLLWPYWVFLPGVFPRHNARTVGGRTEKSGLLRGA